MFDDWQEFRANALAVFDAATVDGAPPLLLAGADEDEDYRTIVRGID
ncbi:hypothetical protein ABIA32_005996 [Streptacidiphilus sp. MAP12-20]